MNQEEKINVWQTRVSSDLARKTAWTELETGLKVFTIFLKMNIRAVLTLLSRYITKLTAQ